MGGVTCPYCGKDAIPGNTVDIGVGEAKIEPDHCENCGAVEIGPFEDGIDLTTQEIYTGWRKGS